MSFSESCLYILAGPTSGEQMEPGSRAELPGKENSVLLPDENVNSHLQRILSQLFAERPDEAYQRQGVLFCFVFYVEAHFQLEFQESNMYWGPRESSLPSPSPEQFIVMVLESRLGRSGTRLRKQAHTCLSVGKIGWPQKSKRRNFW